MCTLLTKNPSEYMDMKEYITVSPAPEQNKFLSLEV